jgi:hypothetical protein
MINHEQDRRTEGFEPCCDDATLAKFTFAELRPQRPAAVLAS